MQHYEMADIMLTDSHSVETFFSLTAELINFGTSVLISNGQHTNVTNYITKHIVKLYQPENVHQQARGPLVGC